MDQYRKQSAGKEPMRISAAADAAGVSVQTLEYYIMLGLIEPLRRPDRQGRWFDAGHVKRIRLIRRLNATGYTLQAIRETYLRGR
jgi:DNA-binding transcriptional MerR regulator